MRRDVTIVTHLLHWGKNTIACPNILKELAQKSK